jgi:hypothetical protein
MTSLINKIKDTLSRNQAKKEAKIRFRFLKYLSDDVRQHGNFYTSSTSVFDKYNDLMCIGAVIPENEKSKLEEIMADLIQLEFEAWVCNNDINACNCEHSYSFQRWYNFHYIARGMLEMSKTPSVLADYLCRLIDIGKIAINKSK